MQILISETVAAGVGLAQLVLISVIALRRARLVLRWVTVLGWVNYLGAEPARSPEPDPDGTAYGLSVEFRIGLEDVTADINVQLTTSKRYVNVYRQFKPKCLDLSKR